MDANSNNDDNDDDEEARVNGLEANPLASLNSERQLYYSGEVGNRLMSDGASILKITASFHKYYANVYQQLALLTSRSTSCLITSFHLIVCHAAVVACLATLMCFLYP